MNVSVFPVNSTNIFPLANDTNGGQLMTEYNLKSRESVETNPNVPYIIGHSFVHGPTDFNIEQYTDSVGTIISNMVLRITKGRAVVDGHYIESLGPVLIDMAELAAQAKLEGSTPLSTGTMAVGLRAMYSTLQTMAGAMRPYNADMLYEGIQVVVLPVGEVVMPGDTKNGVQVTQDEVNMHLKLGEFEIYQDAIVNKSCVQNTDRMRFLDASRVSNFDNLVDDTYLTKTGLNPKKLYTFAGKGTDPNTGEDTWCDSTDALIVWDGNPTLGTTAPSVREASFGISISGKTQLVMPHKQVPDMKDTAGNTQYYQDKIIDLPLADFSAGTSGTVDRAYTNNIKAITRRINELYNLPAGRQIGFIPSLTNREVGGTPTDESLPRINNNWNYGDYLIVGADTTVDETMDSVSAPSTMYQIIPGVVASYAYKSMVQDSMDVPSSITGRCIDSTTWILGQGNVSGPPNTSDAEVYGSYFDLSGGYHAQKDVDYFYIKYMESEDADTYSVYYYTASAYEDESKMYSTPIHLTGQIGLATEETIGGFYNVPETALDNGYIYRDETGHLRLLDYALLRSGVLAYQLGESFEVPAGISHEEVQNNLDEYVNQRVAFANNHHATNADNAEVIDITMDLSEEEQESTINIYDIDSRFNTSIYIHIKGTPGQNCTINISNCQKVRIDSNIPDDVVVNLRNCCLYYDAGVIDRLNTIQNMSLWYERFDESDPELLVNQMSVRCVDEPIIPDDIDYWNTSSPNDNHFAYALQSITFAPNGDIVGAGIYVKNETTANIADGRSILSAKFTLPQGSGLVYPKSRLNKQIKISGEFVQAYVSDAKYKVIDTKFTALTNTYSRYDVSVSAEGVIAFYTDVDTIGAISGLDAGTPLDCWEGNSFYVFQGVAI